MVGGEPPSGREAFQTMEELREREPLSIMEMKSSHAALSNLGKRKEWLEESGSFLPSSLLVPHHKGSCRNDYVFLVRTGVREGGAICN